MELVHRQSRPDDKEAKRTIFTPTSDICKFSKRLPRGSRFERDVGQAKRLQLREKSIVDDFGGGRGAIVDDEFIGAEI